MSPIHGNSVLLVDDDPEILWGLGKYLTRNDFKVTTCVDGAEAVPYLENTPCDILITDIQMPKLNGFALLEWVRKNRPHVRIIVITAFGSEAIKQLSLRKGAILYLEKPLDPKILIDVIQETESVGSFAGSINQIDLFDYVQLILVTKRTLCLEVTSRKNERGFFYVEKGNVVHAVCEDASGEEAFYRCLGFEGGSFTSLPWEEPDARTIELGGEFLLMEAARIKDEGNMESNDSTTDDDEELTFDLFDQEEKGGLF